MSRHTRTVFALIGPKGAGKSFLGRLAERQLGIAFADVEALALSMRSEERSAPYAIYSRVAQRVGKLAALGRDVSIDLTGASPDTARLLAQLEKTFTLRLVKVTAPLEECLRRIAARDPTRHLPADEAMIRKVHDLFTALTLDFDLVIENVGLSDGELIALWRTLEA